MTWHHEDSPHSHQHGTVARLPTPMEKRERERRLLSNRIGFAICVVTAAGWVAYMIFGAG